MRRTEKPPRGTSTDVAEKDFSGAMHRLIDCITKQCSSYRWQDLKGRTYLGARRPGKPLPSSGLLQWGCANYYPALPLPGGTLTLYCPLLDSRACPVWAGLLTRSALLDGDIGVYSVYTALVVFVVTTTVVQNQTGTVSG